MTKVIAVANNKGGCGKTATSFYLGKLLAGMGVRTLLVDLDPQANLTEQIFIGQAPTIADVLSGGPGSGDIRQAMTVVDREGNLWLCPGEFQLANVALGLLNDAVRGRTALRRALRSTPDSIDLVLIDCPPEAGILLVNALLAAHGVICPAEPEIAALDGVRRVAEMVDIIRTEYERDEPVMLGTVATRVDHRTNRHLDGVERMRQSALVPLLGCVPERNGASRHVDLMHHYQPIADHIADWIKEAGHARPAQDE